MDGTMMTSSSSRCFNSSFNSPQLFTVTFLLTASDCSSGISASTENAITAMIRTARNLVRDE